MQGLGALERRLGFILNAMGVLKDRTTGPGL